MMEAMRLSLLEHEEQQRREAQAQSRQDGTTNAEGQQAAPVSMGAATSEVGSRPELVPEPLQFIQQQQSQQTTPRSSSLSFDGTSSFAPLTRYPTNTQEFGLSSAMMAELSELVEGGTSSTASNAAATSPAPSTPPSVSAAQPIVQSLKPSSATPLGSPSNHPSTPQVGSPSRIGTNPNNPFRRLGGSATNSPSHSRQGSALYSTARTSFDNRDGSNRNSGNFQ